MTNKELADKLAELAAKRIDMELETATSIILPNDNLYTIAKLCDVVSSLRSSGMNSLAVIEDAECVKPLESVWNYTEFENLCKPVVEYMKKNCSLHDTVIISSEQIRIVQDLVGIPIRDNNTDFETISYEGVCPKCSNLNKWTCNSNLKPSYCTRCGSKMKYTSILK